MTNDHAQNNQRNGDQARQTARKIAKRIFSYCGLIMPNGAIDIIADTFRAHESAEIERYREALRFANGVLESEISDLVDLISKGHYSVSDCMIHITTQTLKSMIDLSFPHTRTALTSGELEGKGENE